jgi:uncharacterized protein YbjQ (UPF0145 family)
MAEKLTAVPRQFVSTIEAIPGYEIVEHHGVVGTVASTAGKKAGSKGFESLQSAQLALREGAWNQGANAIVGVHAAPFGASMGGVMGDAVGVLLLGTAVTIRRLDEPDEDDDDYEDE